LSPSISLAFAGGRQPAHARGSGGMDRCRPIVRWPRDWGHHGAVQQVRCTCAGAFGMVTIDIPGTCGWSSTRACTRVRQDGLVSLNCSMATPLWTPWRGATGPLRSRGCPGNGHHQSLLHLRVVANPRMHAVGAGWTCVAQLFNGHAIGDTMAWCIRSVAVDRMPVGWSPWISLAFAGGRQPAHARGWGGFDLCRPIVRWPHNCGPHGVVQHVRCIRADALRMVTIDLSGICGWSPTRACTRLGRGGLVSPNSTMPTQLGTPLHGAAGPVPSRGCPGDGHHQSLWHLRVVASAHMNAVGAGWTCVAQWFHGHAVGSTMASCSRSVALALMPWESSKSISLAFAGGRQWHMHAVGAGWTCVA